MERQKLTVTIHKDLFKQIDAIIDGEKIRNRSHATEYLITKGLGINKVRKAFILAGGKGTRLRPLTYELPKPMIPVHDRPLLEHIFELLIKHDIRDVIVSIGYKGNKIVDYFKDGKKYGLKITYVKEKTPLGTAGPLKAAKKYLTEPFFLIWGDILADIDLTDFAHFHRETNAVATLALTSVSDPSPFGVVKMRGHNILDFIEKPLVGDEPSKLINAGYALCNPEIITYIKKNRSMMESDIYPKLAANGLLAGYPFFGQWFDTGTIQTYEKVLKEWKGIS